MSGCSRIRIVLADDHKIMRDGLKALFRDQAGMEVVGEAGDGKTAEQVVRQTNPHVLALGINVAGIHGVETARRFSQMFPDLRIVAHSTLLERAFVVEMLKAGTSAYVHKSHAFPELVRAIGAAVSNEVYLCPKATSVVIHGYVRGSQPGSDSTNGELTVREREVLKLLADGKASKQIGLELHISFKTVDTHRRQIMTKLGLYSLAELTKYAIRCGLTSID